MLAVEGLELPDGFSAKDLQDLWGADLPGDVGAA
jgi:hypothetical protein